jgi:hypothetical protein
MASDILGRVQALLDRANHPETNSHEREVCLKKAEALMSAHRIDEAALAARSVARGIDDRSKRQVQDREIQWVSDGDEFREIHMQTLNMLLRLTGCKCVLKGWGRIHVVGLGADIDYFQMLWTSSFLAFSGKLFPEWNRGMSPHRQIRTWVEAGYKWDYIWQKAREEGQPFKNRKGEEIKCPPADNGWMKRQLEKAYVETGEVRPKLRHSVRDYRNSYALGFGEEMTARIWDMIYTRQDAERQAEGGAQLVLASDVDAVLKRFNELFPPSTLGSAERGKSIQGNNANARGLGAAAARSADLGNRSGVGAGAGRREIG